MIDCDGDGVDSCVGYEGITDVSAAATSVCGGLNNLNTAVVNVEE